MKTSVTIRRGSTEKGVALLIALFALLLISALGLALVFAAGSETFIGNNFKSNTRAFYAAYDGLEEARGRLSPGNPNTIPIPGGELAPGNAISILNPAGGEADVPWNHVGGNPYDDTEFAAEWGAPITAAKSGTWLSSFLTNPNPAAGGAPAPAFKWVRITAKTEASSNTDIDGNNIIDPANTPVYYDGSTQYINPASHGTSPAGKSGFQVFVVTSLAVLPNGSKRLVQYETAALASALQFPSPLTVMSSQIAFSGANSAPYHVNAVDGSGGVTGADACIPNPPLVTGPAIGVSGIDAGTTATDVNSVVSGIPGNRSGNYTGAPPPGGALYNATPSVGDVTNLLNKDALTPGSLDQVVQDITQSADVYIPHDATQADLGTMSASNPQTVVVDGNFSMTGGFTGYGLLVVTGNFAYSGDCGWKGVIMVIGNGSTTFLGNGGGNNEFDGAVLVAATKDNGGNLLDSLGPVNFDINGGGGNGVYFNSCWIKKAQKPASYKVLSFREITQ